jgi:hypothetical protein
VQLVGSRSQITVMDGSGRVADVTAVSAQRLTDPDAIYVIEALPDERLINIVWRGGGCDASTLAVGGRDEELYLSLTIYTGEAIPGAVCGTSGETHALSLTMTEPIDRSEISFIHRRDPG